MESLTWTGALGAYLNPVFTLAVLGLILTVASYLLLSAVENTKAVFTTGPQNRQGPAPHSETLADFIFPLSAITAILGMVYLLAGIVTPYGTAGIIGELGVRFLPVWIALAVTFFLSLTYKRKLGLYGKLFDSPIGMVGFAIVMFWVFTAIFVAMDMVITHDPLGQVSGMKNKLPGTPLRGAAEGDYTHYLLGGDNLARDVFSRMVKGSQVVLVIAPAATLFAFMVGITLGLPAGYFGGKLDTVISFMANLVLAFPVILLFFLLVTPEIRAAGIQIPGTGYIWTVPTILVSILFLFPLVFLVVLFDSRYFTQPAKRNLYVGLTVLIGGYIYLGLAWDADPFGLISIDGGVLIVFVSVVFVNSPTVFRIVRGLVLDIKTRDYVAAGQTRGEGPWYIMLWEILPNARGPLIVDFCLRIGYTTILLGTLGFFGLGLSSESPDWGTTINAGRRLLSIYPHPAIVPAIALMSLVLGLNLLADGLREESLKD